MSIKPRTQSVLTENQFVTSADQVEESLDENAPRTYKAHTIQMNRYEHEILKEVAKKYGQTHSGVIRFALKKLNDAS